MSPNQIFQRNAMPRRDLALGQLGGSPSAASTAGAPATSQAQIVGLAIGCVIGGLILVAIIVILVVLRIRRRRHRQAVAELEQNNVPVAVPQMEQAGATVQAARGNGLRPLRAGTRWDFLASTETVNTPEQAGPTNKRKRPSFFPIRPEPPAADPTQAQPKHLSAIVETLESPRSRHGSSNFDLYSNAVRINEVMGTKPHTNAAQQNNSNIFTAPGSPKPEAIPSFAIKSPATYNPLFPKPDLKLGGTIRSVSLGVLRVDTSGAVLGNTDRLSRQIAEVKRPRPAMHARSASLGAPLSRPPSGPIPPLPVISPLTMEDPSRQGVCIPRAQSAGSINSTSSSILVTSPILARKDSDQPLSSPTVEELVAESDDAALKTVSNGQWQQPRPRGPARISTNTNMAMQTERSRASVKANLVRSSTDSAFINRESTSSFSSTDSMDRNRLSIPIVATADRVSISRVSSSNSLTGVGGVQKIVTPRKTRRPSSVSAQGSPAEKNRRSAILKDISGNAQHCNIKKRNVSISTQDSGRSSNGNPFHWDNNMAKIVSKPSALKGSPNARKGHRRQNCVRISTLTPQVLGPESSRSSSSSPAGIVMDEITEERESDEIKREVQNERRKIELAVAHERRRSTLPRPPLPPRQTSSESCLRIQTLRASLTPSSPTLSSWNTYHDVSAGGLTSHPSDCALSTRPDSRQSDRSSAAGSFMIPKFPSPARTSVALTRSLPEFDTAPMPDLSFDLESPTLGFDEKNSSSPFTLAMSSDDEVSPVSPRKSQESSAEISPVSSADLPSSPPLPVARSNSYDPSWPAVVHIPPPIEGNEYDPASPPHIWDDEGDMQRSSLFLPFANLDDFALDGFSIKSRPSSYALPDSPPLSPKTTLQDRKLTSENASSIMASMPNSTSTSSFLGTSIPSLLPSTAENNDMAYLPRWEPTPAPLAQPQRQPFVAVAPSLPTIPQSDDHDSPAPAPLNIKPAKHVPQEPRSAPAKSVLKNAMALRRMNSEVSKEVAALNRESRNYVRLGREASPLLPWCPATPKSDTEGAAADEIFDFDFDGNASAGATERLSRHGVPLVDSPKYKTMDEIDFSGYEHNASAGFILPAAEKPAPLRLKYTGDPRPTHREHISPRSLKYSQQQQQQHKDRQLSRESSIYSQPTPTKTPAASTSTQNRTSVWDDGEKFWSSPNTNQKHESIGSHKLPLFSQATPDGKTGRMTPTISRLRQESVQMEAGATPKSLYDSDGFLKA
ncbi:hypothetical protein CLAFUW4_06877 [Fulvia fulva]|uniref:Uncharacterized protein n=1 Tax=Passalora fulva TaxID=5499 RepID=A0A9Q8LJN2_PASFU|nr:uncharacterized protein CLAFUR5_07015 [Fulvia fulva]KAK4622160.1 hypothetical protein CLAFUR4_06885 [Fulvia fulva]KAK4622671.1 hypothetical protein CLAFUR0_06882 [Fulvia fulva]UJO18414.1 hypothetical protein CLAFUR5_07015 [Fulvia fulva]WPV16303.1 hypothetical protein CLAFUW4_06877 [Fulvia fulva]WPV31547.1 hypothetical protein CLAFUW7_06876 [Fulvia fulva]